MLECRGLRKSFGDRLAVNGVSFSIAGGECYGLLGPNGAGKTTTISMLCGLLRPDGGEVTVDGAPGGSLPAKAAIGYVPQDLALYPDLTAVENLTFFGRLYGMQGVALKRRIAETLELVGLTERRDDKVGTYSGGMKRRANMAAGLLHGPKLLVLDEPTVGVDPQSRNAILETVAGLGIAVLYTTHYMEEAAKLCHRIGIIDDGRLIAEGTAGQLLRAHGGTDRVRLTLAGADDGFASACRRLGGVRAVHQVEGGLELSTDHGPGVLPTVVGLAGTRGVELTGVEVVAPDLEGVFLALTGKELPRLIRVIALNELRRRLRDRSMVISCIVAPLAMAAILGLSYGNGGSDGPLSIGVTGASAPLVAAARHAVQLPADVVVHLVARAATLRSEVENGTLAGGVVLSARRARLSDLLIPIVAPGSRYSPGFDVVTQPSSLLGQEWAETLASGLSSRLYAGRVRPGTASDLAAISVATRDVGHGGKGLLNYFAPSISVVFLFIGSGLGMRSLLLERSAGTLVRMAAAPIRPIRIVIGKLLAIFLTGLATILIMWGVTTFAFGADWGSPPGVLLVALGATLAMCGLGVFLTSLARDEQQAFGIVLLVGLALSLVGGNLLPAGALPPLFQTLSLATPNGWAQVGFGRLALLSQPAGSVVGPFLVLLLIAVVTGGLALTRVRRMVEP